MKDGILSTGTLTALYKVTSLTSSVIYIYLHNINYANKIKNVVDLIVVLLHLQILDCIKDKIGVYDSLNILAAGTSSFCYTTKEVRI